MTYSKTVLASQTIATTNDPRAIDPRLYLKAHQNPFESEKLLLPQLQCEKYHVHVATIRTYWIRAEMIRMIQKRARTYITIDQI